MKKILLFLVFVFIFLFFGNNSIVNSNCSYDGNIGNSISDCFKNTNLVGTDSNNNLKVDGKGFQEKLTTWRNTLAIYLGIAAVFGLVFSAFILATSTGEEEKINKAKSIAKWTIIGFLAIIFSSTIIIIIVNIFYSF